MCLGKIKQTGVGPCLWAHTCVCVGKCVCMGAWVGACRCVLIVGANATLCVHILMWCVCP